MSRLAGQVAESDDLMIWMIFFAVYIGLCLFFLLHTVRFLIHHHVISENYKLHKIPTAFGVYLWLMLILYVFMLKIWRILPGIYLAAQNHLPLRLESFTFMLTLIMFMGWLDDTLGDRQIKGIAQHWNRWKKDKVVTTGLLKIGVTCSAALWIVLESSQGLLHAVISFAVIVFMTNTLNLFDLRPGRALKVYFLLSSLLIMHLIFRSFLQLDSVHWFDVSLMLAPTVLPTLLIFHKDLKSQLMIGDTGSNYLGFAMGVYVSLFTTLMYQCALLMVLLAIHWLAAKSSLTALISKYRMTHWLDHLGRKPKND